MKFKSRFQAVMWSVSLISFLCLIISFHTYSITKIDILYTAGVTALTIFYHFTIRLFLGEWLLIKLLPAKPNYNNKWFQPRQFEKQMYEKLNIKKLKKHIPTYSPDEYSISNSSFEDITFSTCKSELIHECNVIMSFIPLLFSFKFGAFVVFLITSVCAACFDLIFVIIQRYNRPRLIKRLKKDNSLSSNK